MNSMYVMNWINGDEEMELSDDAIADLIANKNNNEEEDDKDTDDATPRITHYEGLKFIEGALAYIELHSMSCIFNVGGT